MTCKMRKRHDLSHAAPEMSYGAVLLDIPFVCAAFLVCGASGLAAHLGFTAGVEETMLLPMLASKLLGGFLGVLLALLGTRGMYGSGNGGNADKKTC